MRLHIFPYWDIPTFHLTLWFCLWVCVCVCIWTPDWFVSLAMSKQLRKEECFASDWLFPWRQVHSNKCHLISNGDVFPQQSSIHLHPDRLTPVQLCLPPKHLWHLQCIIPFGITEGQRGGDAWSHVLQGWSLAPLCCWWRTVRCSQGWTKTTQTL